MPQCAVSVPSVLHSASSLYRRFFLNLHAIVLDQDVWGWQDRLPARCLGNSPPSLAGGERRFGTRTAWPWDYLVTTVRGAMHTDRANNGLHRALCNRLVCNAGRASNISVLMVDAVSGEPRNQTVSPRGAGFHFSAHHAGVVVRLNSQPLSSSFTEFENLGGISAC